MATNFPIELKVRASAAVAALVGVAFTLLNSVGSNSTLLGPVPPWAQSIITLLAPPLAVLLAGWAAPHSPRTAASVVPALVTAAVVPPVAVTQPVVAPDPITVPVAVVPAPQAVDPVPVVTA